MDKLRVMPKMEGFIAEVSPDLLAGSLSITPLQVTATGMFSGLFFGM